MNLSERNKINILCRWKKQHEKELNWIKSQKNTDFLKARICGYLAGDGNISIRKEKSSTKTHYEIRFFPDHASLIKPYMNAFEKTYNKTPSIFKENNHYVLRINSKIVVYDLLSLCSFGLKSWSIPTFDSKKCKIEWLRAMFDSDAYVGNKNVRLKTVNGLGIESVKKLLNEFDIKSSKIYQYKPKKRRWSINYILDIRRKESLKKFSELIGFNHKIKEGKLLNLIEKSNMPRKLCRDYKISNA